MNKGGSELVHERNSVKKETEEDGTIYRRPMKPQYTELLVIENNRGVSMIKLDRTMTLGYDEGDVHNDIVLHSGIVSHEHGVFIYNNTENSFYYKDNNSTNGTFINGCKLSVPEESNGSPIRKLNNGDVIRIDRDDLSNPHPEAVCIIYSKMFQKDVKWKHFQLGKNKKITIGRSKDNDIVLHDFMASRWHAVIKRIGETWWIIDKRSKNGISVNGECIQLMKRLNPLDCIRIVNTIMVFTGSELIYNIVDTEMYEKNLKLNQAVLSVNISEVNVGTKKHLLKKKPLLKDVYLDIAAGEFVLILGGAGAGKTTFLKAVLGEYRAKGEILMNGMNLYKNFKMLKHKIGWVPQFSTTRDNDTVYHTIMDSAVSMLSGEHTKEEIKQRVDDVIERMMLKDRTENIISSLSGGQKKRVEVAKLAVGEQEVFILDEPDSGMDYASRMDLMRNLKSCAESGNIVAVITHSPDAPAELFTKVIVLAKSRKDDVGRLAYYGDVEGAYRFFGVNKLSEIVMEINYEGGHGRADYFIEKFQK